MQLGSMDESATDEEQGEKILYYYPRDVSVYWQVCRFCSSMIRITICQLSKMTMVESLMEFSNKFCPDPIDVVVMEVWNCCSGTSEI